MAQVKSGLGRTKIFLTVGLLAAGMVLALNVGNFFQGDGVMRCKEDSVHVEMGVDLRKARDIEVEHRIGVHLPEIEEMHTDKWRLINEDVSCPNDVSLTVRRGDIWGGYTRCWIRVNHDKIWVNETTSQSDCHVLVRLVKS